MRQHDFRIGRRVRLRRPFRGLAEGTPGVVDERTLIFGRVTWFVAWDLPGLPLPTGYHRYTPDHAGRFQRDGFAPDEVAYLERADV